MTNPYDVAQNIQGGTRQTDFINTFWRVAANDPAQLEHTWAELKDVMAPGALDPLVKELIYIAVSTANGCAYCIRSHTAAATSLLTARYQSRSNTCATRVRAGLPPFVPVSHGGRPRPWVLRSITRAE